MLNYGKMRGIANHNGEGDTPMKRLGCVMLATMLLLTLCSGFAMAEKVTLTYLDPIPTVERTAMLNGLIAQF